jgi:hypothetical protein
MRNSTFLNTNSAGANSNLLTRVACAAYSVGLNRNLTASQQNMKNFLSFEYFCKFSQKFLMAPMVSSEARGKLIHEKKP